MADEKCHEFTVNSVVDPSDGMARCTRCYQKTGTPGCSFTRAHAAPNLVAPPHLVAFWQNLPHATISDQLTAGAPGGSSGKLFTISNHARILGRSDLDSSFYLRPSYEPTYNKIVEILGASQLKGVVVAGTPGIGKSIFACYLLYRLHQANPSATILYVDYKRQTMPFMIFSHDGVKVVGGLNELSVYMESPLNFVIFDLGGNNSPAVSSVGVRAQMIILIGECGDNFASFYRDCGNMVVLTNWSKYEVDEARQHLYTGDHLHDYELRFRDLGGVPRWVFHPNASHDQVLQQFHNDIPPADDIHKLLQLKDLTKIKIPDGAPLITFEVDGAMRVTRARWVSDRIGQWAMQTLMRNSIQRTMNLLCQLSYTPQPSGAFGMAFAAYAHLILAGGGRWEARDLDTGCFCRVSMRRSFEPRYFDHAHQVKDDCYTRPNNKKGAESIDGLYRPHDGPDHLVQVSVNTNTDVSLTDLKACIAGLPSSTSQTFLIVVPKTRALDFTCVRLLPTGDGEGEWPASVTQKLVVSIPIQPVSEDYF